MERVRGENQAGLAIDRQELINNLKSDKEFLEKPEKTQLLHFEAIDGFLTSLGPLKDAKLNLKTLFDAKTIYLNYLMNNGFAKKEADNLGWVLAFNDDKFDPETRIQESLKLARDAAKFIAGIFTVTNFFRMGEDKTKLAERYGFNPGTTLLYKTGNLTVGGLLQRQPWILMETDFVKKHYAKMEELSEAREWAKHISPESKKIDIVRFSDHDREVLLKDGASIYQVKKENLHSLRKVKWKYSSAHPFFSIPDNFSSILNIAARPMEVAIYTDTRFLIKESYDKSKSEKETLLIEDADKLKSTLGLQNITEILPEAPEAASVLYQNYLEKREVLLGSFDIMPEMNDGHHYRSIFLMLNNLVESSSKFTYLENVPSVALLTMNGGSLDFLDDYVIGGGTFAARWIVPSQIKT
jgi:hypothetical protein